MTIHPPLEITPSLEPGARIGDGWLSITYARHTGRDGRTRYQWRVILPDGSEHVGDDLQSGCGGGSLLGGLCSLLDFLCAAAESAAYARHTGRPGDNSDLFPPAVVEWADQHSDELAMLALALEESDTPAIQE